MVRGGPGSWNIRDHHMAETLERLMRHYGSSAKAIVWEHNTHIGDARFTDMADAGMVNVGQLVRRRHADLGVMLIGFASYQGTVIAAREWEAPMERMDVPPAVRGSWESVLHEVGSPHQLFLPKKAPLTPEMFEPRGHRAIGVVYRPEAERGNYVPTVLPQRYDALLYIDTTHALHPLHDFQPIVSGEVPETYPTGI
jgi:erythromycin esterase-like protein